MAPIDQDPDASSGNVIVSLQSVAKCFGAVVALRELSLDIRRGEFLTLLGPSGCGKTTTLRLINGFELPSGGSVAINGRRMNDVPPFRRDVNTVFQSYALFPHLTVYENVAYGLVVKRLSKRQIEPRVRDMLARVGLTDKAGRRPRELSGGQMQRVALARALINEPAVLLLDEPLGALDAKLRRSMQLELRRMHQDLGLTIVCVTHDQEEALVMSDRIAVMNSGEIIQLGTPREIFERPNSRFVAEFIGGSNLLHASVNGDGQLVLNDGTLLQASIGGLPRPVTVAIRPQKLRLSASPGDGPGFSATVRDVAYLGASRRVVLGSPGGGILHAELPETAVPGADPVAGQNVRVSFDPGDLIVFEE
jgi:spermidine/putrescine transport system ATP-binding protein